MKILKLMLLSLTMLSSSCFAQNVGVELAKVVKNVKNQVEVTLGFDISNFEQRNWSRVKYSIALTDGRHVAELSDVVYKKGTREITINHQVVDYLDWMKNAKLRVVKQLLNAHNKTISTDAANISFKMDFVRPVTANTPDAKQPAVEPQQTAVTQQPAENNKIQAVVTSSGFVGSYTVPEEDAADKESKKELYLTMDQMRICENITPDLLTLRQLYDVAMSYRNEDPDKYYEVMMKTVQLFNTSPVANLNAASICLEKGDLAQAAEFLKNTRMGSPEYKNVRGIYDILTKNFSEGIKLLKAAKAAGSVEADYNLEYFFNNYQNFVSGQTGNTNSTSDFENESTYDEEYTQQLANN